MGWHEVVGEVQGLPNDGSDRLVMRDRESFRDCGSFTHTLYPLQLTRLNHHHQHQHQHTTPPFPTNPRPGGGG